MMLLATVFVACSDDDDEKNDDNGNGNGDEKGWVVTMDRIIDYEKEATLMCAGSGKMEIDWGDGTITKDLELPLYEEYNKDFEGDEFTHAYAKEGSYKITIKGDVKLTYLDVDCDTVTSLDVTKCPALIRLDCNDNELKTLDVSKCTELVALRCYSNELTALNVSACTKLRRLDCNYNKLTSLDISKCIELNYLDCHENQFSEAAMNVVYNDLPDRTGKDTGTMFGDAKGDATIAKNKNWDITVY